MLASSNLAIFSSRFWINDSVNLSHNSLIHYLWYNVKILLWWHLSSKTLSLVGIEIVPLLYINPVDGSTKSLSLSISLGLQKCLVIPIDIFL